jgi:hypothetical protein
MVSPEHEFKAIWDGSVGDRPVGHDHFWERALSRRQLVTGAAGAFGAAASASLWFPGLAGAAAPVGGAPNPIPGTTTLPFGAFHFFFPAAVETANADPSLITDFNGFIGLGDFTGGTGKDQAGTTRYWKADVRFMTGEYVDVSGRHRQGAFAFV